MKIIEKEKRINGNKMEFKYITQPGHKCGMSQPTLGSWDKGKFGHWIDLLFVLGLLLFRKI